jgi:hypothetical protein
MFGTINFGVRAFLIGLVVGVLVAPRAGVETRRLLRARLQTLLDGIAELLAVPSAPIELPERSESRRRRASPAQ